MSSVLSDQGLVIVPAEELNQLTKVLLGNPFAERDHRNANKTMQQRIKLLKAANLFRPLIHVY
jgi:hypothetical protein